MITANQTTAGIPIWELLIHEIEVGSATCFPGEGYMATVRFENETRTVSGSTLPDLIERASDAFADLEFADYAESEDHIEDEDGSIAFAVMLETRAEMNGRFEDDPWF